MKNILIKTALTSGLIIISIIVSVLAGFIALLFTSFSSKYNYGFVMEHGIDRINSISDNLGIFVGIIVFIILMYKGLKGIYYKPNKIFTENSEKPDR